MQPITISTKSSAFELKGSFLTLTVLYLLQTEITAIVTQLSNNIKKSPNLFKHMPIVIDLQKVSKDADPISFNDLNGHLRQLGLVPVGVRNGSDDQHEAAMAAGLGILPESTKRSQAAAAQPQASAPQTQLITKPIRSGQQIYARNANLVVLANVSHGAELLADGCIHVYSALRGRALAGVSGDKTARIFCQKLEAELVSVAGYYKLQEDIQAPQNAAYTQIYLQDEQLQISSIDITVSKAKAD